MQMEAARRRKDDERVKRQLEEEKKWQEIQSYNPWGRPGAGAPRAVFIYSHVIPYLFLFLFLVVLESLTSSPSFLCYNDSSSSFL